MKKLILTGLMAGIMSASSYAHVDLYGIYVRLNQQNFYCAIISKNLCARVSKPLIDDPNTSNYVITTYHPDGTVAENFTASRLTITENGSGTLVNYLP